MLQISEQEIRYLASLSLTFIFSYLFFTHQKDTFNVPWGFLILLVAHGRYNLLYYICTIIISLVLFYLLRKKISQRLGDVLMFFNLSLLLIYKHAFFKHDLEISAPLMLLVIKFYYLGKEYFYKDDLRTILVYLFLVPGILTGPVPSYKQFIEYKRTINLNLGIRKIVESFIYFAIFALFRNEYKVTNISPEISIGAKILILVTYIMINKTKFYFAWTFAHGNFLFLGYNYQNILPMGCEFALNLRQMHESWNIYTNRWLKKSVFEELKWTGYFNASLATFFVSALWHGININYFLMFISISLCIPLLKNNELLVKQYLPNNCSYVVQIILTTLFTAYFSVPFFLLNLNMTLKTWRSIYFYGHLYILLSFIIYCFFKTKKQK